MKYIQKWKQVAAEKRRNALVAKATEYDAVFRCLPAELVPYFDEPVNLAQIHSLSTEELHKMVAALPADAIASERFKDEIAFRDAMEKPNFPCYVQIEGNERAVGITFSVSAGAMTSASKRLFLLNKIMLIQEMIGSDDYERHAYVIIRQFHYKSSNYFTERRLRQRGIGRVPDGVYIGVDNHDIGDIYVKADRYGKSGSEEDINKYLHNVLVKVRKHSSTATRLHREFYPDGPPH